MNIDVRRNFGCLLNKAIIARISNFQEEKF